MPACLPACQPVGRRRAFNSTIPINHLESGVNVGWHFKSIARVRLKRAEEKTAARLVPPSEFLRTSDNGGGRERERAREGEGEREPTDRGQQKEQRKERERERKGARKRRPAVLAARGGERNEGARYVFDVQKVIMGWFPVIISRAH